MLGIQCKQVKARSIFVGVIVGTLIAVYLTMGSNPKPYGIHAGIWGLGMNFLTILIIQFAMNKGRTGTPTEER